MNMMKTPRSFSATLDLDWFVDRYKDHICPEVQILALSRTPVTERLEASIYARHGLNSYERHVLYQLMTPECLIKSLENTLANCQRVSFPLPGCYDESVVQVFAPLLAWHLQRQMQRKTLWQKIKKIFVKDS